MASDDESRNTVYRDVMNRFRDLEVSYAKLTEQFEVMVRERGRDQRRREVELSDSGEVCLNSGWGRLPGVFLSKSPYGRVLQSMGHAVYVCRASDGEIIFWNRSAEKLYGWKDYEVHGQRLADLLIEEHNYASIEKIMERLSIGQSWSGKFHCKRRSGEMFMAMVTKSPLYEDGELLGVITVSSDAAAFSIINSENLRTTYQGRADVPTREPRFNMKRIQWHPQPHIASVPQISSSVSNLAFKVFSRRRGDDDTCGACASSKNGEPALDNEGAKSVKAATPELKPSFRFPMGKNTTEGNNYKKEEPTLGFVQPSKIAEKVLGKLSIRGRGSHVQEECRSAQSHDLAEVSTKNAVGSALNLPIISRGTSLDHHNGGIEKMGADSDKRNPFHSIKHEYSDGKGLRIQHAFEGDSSATNENPFVNSWLECNEYYYLPRIGNPLPRLDLEGDRKEALPNSENLDEVLEAEATVQHNPQITPSPTLLSPVESTGSSHENSSTKGDKESNSIVDCEIHWEDLHVGEEIGQGSYAVVYRGVWNGSDVAIKVFSGVEYREATLLDYKKEIAIMKRLRHPNVLLFMGAVYSPERLAIVTEFLPRGSLFKTLHRNNQSLDIRRRLRMALDVARGVNYLHHRNPPIVHRDLKSTNLLVDRNWTVKVGDFGLSKLKNATFLTAKSGRGTPQWMAPEVLRNEPSNEKSDVFSFGVILWELMTESIPWNNLNSLQVVGIVGFMDRKLDIPESLDPPLSHIIQDCWESVPERRPSFQDLIQRITDLIETFPAAPAQRSSVRQEI